MSIPITVKDPTIVKSVTVGTPIRSVTLAGSSLRGLSDVDIDSNRQDGDALVWVLGDAKWRNRPLQTMFDSDINALTIRVEANDSNIAALLAADSSFAGQITIINGSLTTINGRLDSQRLDYIARDAVLQDEIDNLASNIESDLQFQIDSNEVLLQSIRTNLQGQIDSNETMSRAADIALGLRIDSNYGVLVTTRTQLLNADSTINDRIDSDYTLLQLIRLQLLASDSALGERIDSNYTLLQTIRSSLVASDSAINNRIDSDYTLLQSIRLALLGADSNLGARIDSDYALLQSTRLALLAADSSLGARIDSDYALLQLIRQQLVNADSTIGDRIDSNYTAFQTAVGSLQSQIDSDGVDIVTIKGQVVSLQGQIDSDGTAIAALDTRLDQVESDLFNLTTTDVPEGTMKYYTKARVDSDIDARITGAGVSSVNGQTGTVTLTTADISEDSNLYFTNERVDNRVATILEGDKGDISVSSAGTVWTIDSGAVTLAKMADVATARIIGRVTVDSGAPEALTGTQATTLLDTFDSDLKGLAPASGGGTTNFLRADGLWVPPPQAFRMAQNSGRFIGPQGPGVQVTTGNYTANVLRMATVCFANDVTVDQAIIRISASGAAGYKGDVFVYELTAPDTLTKALEVLDISTPSNAAHIHNLGTNFTFLAGRIYAIGVCHSNTPTGYTFAANGGILMGGASSATQNGYASTIHIDLTQGAGGPSTIAVSVSVFSTAVAQVPYFRMA